jgi:hypothetical protein
MRELLSFSFEECMKSSKFKEISQLQQYLSSDDLKSIHRELGYSSSRIYENTLKYRRQNFVSIKRSKQLI